MGRPVALRGLRRVGAACGRAVRRHGAPVPGKAAVVVGAERELMGLIVARFGGAPMTRRRHARDLPLPSARQTPCIAFDRAGAGVAADPNPDQGSTQWASEPPSS